MRRFACQAALAASLVLGLLAPAAPAFAGPPFVTDDPQPTDEGHWEVYSFTNLAHTPGSTGGEAGLDMNYGGAKDLQLTLVVPLAYDQDRTGMGVVEAAAKYKLLHQREGSWTPDVAVFPRLFLPTASRGFDTGHVQLLLPVWAQKDFAGWSLFGGGGYQINPGADNRNFWTGGVALSRRVNERLMLGAEVYHHTPDSVGGRQFTGVNLGGQWKLNKHWSLMLAGGPGVQNAREEGQYDVYFALKADY